jgi:hypothetical protein
MEWRVGDNLHLVNEQNRKPVMRYVVTEVGNEYLTIRPRGRHMSNRPTHKVRISQVEQWWRERVISVNVEHRGTS